MRVHLAHQVQALLGQSALGRITERVDAVAWLLGHRVTMGFVEVRDRPLPRHGTHRGSRWGGTAVRGLAALRTEGDHRTGSVDADSKGRHTTRSPLSAQGIDPRECRDERRGELRPSVRPPQDWQRIAEEGHAHSRAVSAFPHDVIRCEATTVAGEHEGREGGWGPCGHRHDAPRRPQSTGMTGALAPVGMPVAPEVRVGERAADGVDIPRIERSASGRHTTGRRVGGAGKRRAVSTRASVAQRQPVSLAPRPVTGTTAAAMAAWRSEGIAHDSAGQRARLVRAHARGDEGARRWWPAAGATAGRARVVVRRSPGPAAPQAAGLATRLAQAEKTRAALTPASGRGTRQRTDEATRREAIDHVRTAQRVAGWRTVPGERQVARPTHAGGRGRGAATRPQRVRATLRSHRPRLARRADPLTARVQRVGGQACVTNTTHERLSLAEAVVCSRNADRLERMCHSRTRRVSLAPLGVKREEPMQGLTSLLTLGVRGCMVREGVLRRALEHAHAHLPGLHPDKRTKMTDTPTAARLLKAWSAVSLPIVKTAAGEAILQRLTPLSALQQAILQRLGLDMALSQQLAMH